MASAQEWIQAPPPGRYNIQIDAAEAGTSKKGESQIKISFSIADGPFKGSSGFHHIGTDGGTKYGAMGKKHLRALGAPVDSDAEVPDSIIAGALQGLRLVAECGNEPRQKAASDAPNAEMVTQYEMDPKTGQKIAVQNLTIIGYIREPGARLALPLPGQQMAPNGQQPVAQGGYAPPQQIAQGLPPQFAPQAGVPQGVPQFAPPNFAPPGVAPGAYSQVGAVAPLPWGNNGVAPGAAPVPQGLPGQPQAR